MNTKTMYNMLQKWNKAANRIQKEASKIFSFVEINDFKEISRLKANNKKKLAIIMFLFWKNEEKNSRYTKNKSNA